MGYNYCFTLVGGWLWWNILQSMDSKVSLAVPVQISKKLSVHFCHFHFISFLNWRFWVYFFPQAPADARGLDKLSIAVQQRLYSTELGACQGPLLLLLFLCRISLQLSQDHCCSLEHEWIPLMAPESFIATTLGHSSFGTLLGLSLLISPKYLFPRYVCFAHGIGTCSCKW